MEENKENITALENKSIEKEKKNVRKTKIAIIVYNLIINALICFCLTLTSSIVGASHVEKGSLIINLNQIFTLNFLWNFLFTYLIANIIGNFVPLVRIGKWFTSLFHVKADTYKGNLKYRLLSTLSTSIIFFIGINPITALFNYYVLKIYSSFKDCFISWAINIPLMLIMGFLAAFFSDFIAYNIAKKIDKNF